MQRPAFAVTSVTWHEVKDKAQSVKLRALLEQLNIKDYSDILEELDYIFMVFPDEVQTWRESRSKYLSSKKVLVIVAWLNYEEFVKASPQEAKQMMANLYLEAIKTYPSIKGMKKVQFDHQKFYADVKALFEREGWVVAA